ALTDTNGLLCERYSLDEFGHPDQGSTISGNPFLYRGGRFDPETGWYHLAHRYLDPSAGRFTTRAAQSAEASGGLFTFAGDNPLSAATEVDGDDDEPPPHFECGQHALWWYQHHPHHHHGHKAPGARPPFGSLPIEMVPLDLQGCGA